MYLTLSYLMSPVKRKLVCFYSSSLFFQSIKERNYKSDRGIKLKYLILKKFFLGKHVAIKKMPHRTEDDKQNNLNELRFISRVKHENIVGYYGSYLWRDELWVVLEMMEGGALTKAISDYQVFYFFFFFCDCPIVELFVLVKPIYIVLSCCSGLTKKTSFGLQFGEKHIAYVCRAVLRALDYLHAMHICHRDLKSENIMLTKKGEVSLFIYYYYYPPSPFIL